MAKWTALLTGGRDSTRPENQGLNARERKALEAENNAYGKAGKKAVVEGRARKAGHKK